MMAEARGFVAVELAWTITSVLAESVSNLKARVGSGVRWSNSENLHMTVNFLGYIPISLIGYATETLADCAATSSPSTLQIDTINTFSDTLRPSLI